MKKIVCFLLMLCLLASLASCGGYTKTTADREGCDEFLSLLLKEGEDIALSGEPYDAAHCYRVTPAQVEKNSDIEIYRFSNSFASFALLDGRVVKLGDTMGKYGFVDGIAHDVNGDGVADLVFTSSWGLGIHRALLSIMDGATGEVTCFYDSTADSGKSTDFVLQQNKDGSISVLTAHIRFSGDEGRISYLLDTPVGQIDLSNGGSFIPKG